MDVLEAFFLPRDPSSEKEDRGYILTYDVEDVCDCTTSALTLVK